MRKKFSRSHWEQVVSRVRKAGGKWAASGKCLLCGKVFLHNGCTHSISENEQVLEKVLAESPE